MEGEQPASSKPRGSVIGQTIDTSQLAEGSDPALQKQDTSKGKNTKVKDFYANILQKKKTMKKDIDENKEQPTEK